MIEAYAKRSMNRWALGQRGAKALLGDQQYQRNPGYSLGVWLGVLPRLLSHWLFVDLGRQEYGYRTSWSMGRRGPTVLQEPSLKSTICPQTITQQHLFIGTISFGCRNVKIASQKLSWNYIWAP